MSLSMQGKSLKKSMYCHITRAGTDQVFIVISIVRETDVAQAARASYAMIAKTLLEKNMEIVHERIFGSLESEEAVTSERSRIFHEAGIPYNTPVTYMQGHPPWGKGLSGIIIRAVTADKVWTIRDGSVLCGRGWRRNGSTCLVLQNINGHGSSPSGNGSKAHQVRRMLEWADRILRENGASYRDVARTWFYLSDILEWYAVFNKVRNEKYEEFGIMPGPGDARLFLPASTGIRGNISSGAAAAMDLLAIVKQEGRPEVEQLSNAAQLDAFRYGSAFSRGAVIKEDDVTLIQVSGTAAIDEHGVSLYPGDIRSQINCTLDRVETLLNQEGAGLRDIAAAMVFLKSPKYAPVFWEMAQDRGLDEFPAVCVVADVCREELLFEVDGEAIVRNKGNRDLRKAE